MRNPIQPSAERPIPLPDCILMDGWWADRRETSRVGRGAVLRLLSPHPDKKPDKRQAAAGRG